MDRTRKKATRAQEHFEVWWTWGSLSYLFIQKREDSGLQSLIDKKIEKRMFSRYFDVCPTCPSDHCFERDLIATMLV